MLKVEDLRAGYGNLPVLHGISFEVAPGEIMLVAGENGAGKSTLMRTLAGFIQPTGGSIRFDGADIRGVSTEDLVRRGLRLVLDGHRVFNEMTVSNNLRLGASNSGYATGDYRARLDAVLETFPILREKSGNLARDLSGGQQQMLALGQAFMAQPRVLLCDEPSMGLAQALLPQILKFLRAWAAEGVGIVIVEQHVDFALPYADRAMLVRRGEVVHQGPAASFAEALRSAA